MGSPIVVLWVINWVCFCLHLESTYIDDFSWQSSYFRSKSAACRHRSHNIIYLYTGLFRGGKIRLSIAQALLAKDLAVNAGIIILKLISLWLLYPRYTRQP